MTIVNRYIKYLGLCLLFCCGVEVLAGDLAQQRKNFLYAEEAIKKGDLTTYYRLKPGLSDYSLYPYLQYAEITRLMRASLPTEHVQRFLKDYPGSVLANRLRSAWLLKLAEQQQWALYQQFYQTSDDTALQCYAIWAEYKIKQKADVLAKATPLWVQGKSQPDECNALFTAWQKSKYYNSAHAWERTKLAAAAKETDLVSYLKRYLPAKQQQLADLWLKLHQNPNLVTTSSLFKNKDPFEQTIQIYALKRLISQDDEKALKAWNSIKDKYAFTTQQRGEVSYAFAIDLATSHDSDAITWLNAVPTAQKDAPIYEWRVRYALRKQDWKNVAQYIKEMPAELQQSPTWRYWQGRALIALNQQDKAQPILKTLAKERNYYGMLASDLTNKPYSLNNAVYPVSTTTKTQVRNNPGIQRATELFAFKRLAEARREWNTTIEGFDEAQLHAASQLARSLDWYDRGILTATNALDRNDLNVRFPLAYANYIKKSAAKNNIDTAWTFALTRQESAFLPDAQSPVGAMGLMQLLPSTAKEVAAKTGKSYTGSQQLIIPERNIAFGTAYLKQLSKQFNNNNILVTAAYNAGASRVYRWMPDEKQSLPVDVWVETIPYRETRNYVQNVFSYVVIYRDHLDQDVKRLNYHTRKIAAL